MSERVASYVSLMQLFVSVIDAVKLLAYHGSVRSLSTMQLDRPYHPTASSYAAENIRSHVLAPFISKSLAKL